MTAEIWNNIDKLSQILGILSVIPILYSAYILFVIRRKKKIELEKIRTQPGDKPGVLIIDTIKEGLESIQPQVENWLWQQPLFEEKKDNVTLETVIFNGELNADDMADITQKIRKAVGNLQSTGVTKYHVFIRGPLGVACVVGCILANHRPSIIYQQASSGGYSSWGAINQ